MKAKEGVIDILNKILTADLTAINQYYLHAKMCENWGYERLYDKVRSRSVDEMKDAVKRVEHRIEEMGMTCRVYTEYRAAAVGASMLFAFVGVASLATVAAHNILTWDPDYELAKSVAKNTLTVTYKKAVKSGTVIDASTF